MKRGDPPVILCSNHISDFDPVFILFCLKRPVYFMAKAELFPNGLAKWFFTTLFGAFPVSRGAGDTGAIDRAVAHIRDGNMMGIYPEGTRSRDGKLLRFKSGAALIASQSGAHVLPVAMMAKGQRIKLFRRTTIVFGDVIPPAELRLDNPESPDLRYATRAMTERISGMMDEYRHLADKTGAVKS